MIGIVNYGSGNIRAIGNIYDKLKIGYCVIEKAEQIKSINKIILPGVGAFDETMSMLNHSGLRDALEEAAMEKRLPVLGICVGMQILSEGSDEGSLEGLGWIKGRVRLFDKALLSHKPKIPHLGWNSVNKQKESALLDNVDEECGFYFIHSFYFECSNKEDILSSTNYGAIFSSAVNSGNIYGVQFHPEKSHNNGIQLLQNFASL